MAQRKDKKAELLGVIGKDWLGRSQIAEALGKKTLNISEIKHLEELVDSGVIESEIHVVGISEKFVYRKP